MTPINMPSGPGIFWARTKGYHWWNLIAHVYGDVPFLKVDLWSVMDCTATEDASIMDIVEFGDMIAPEIPNVEGDRDDFS